MLRAAKHLLDLCTERFPSPRSCQHHSLTIREGFLNLTLMQGDTWLSLDFSEVDLERRPEDLVEEIAVMVVQAAEERAAEAAKKAAEPTPPDETA